MWGVVFGALSVFALVALFRSIEALDRSADPLARDCRVMLATIVVVTSPLFWFTALRPLSDMTGLGMALVAQACLASAVVRRRMADAAHPAAIADRAPDCGWRAYRGLAVGARTQTIWLTFPLLGVVLLDRTGRGGAGALLGSAMTFSIGVMAWAVPLLVASGGLARYRAVFAGQAAEQFTGLDIFLSHPTPRRLALGIIAALVGPWAAPPLGWIVVAIAIAGLAWLAWRAPLAAGLLLVAYVPYAVFHSLFRSRQPYASRSCLRLATWLVRGLSAAGANAAAFGSAAIPELRSSSRFRRRRRYGTYPVPSTWPSAMSRSSWRVTPGSVVGAHHRFARALETRESRRRSCRPRSCASRPPLRRTGPGWDGPSGTCRTRSRRPGVDRFA